MKPRELSPLVVAADALEQAKEVLESLPVSLEVCDLQRRWHAIRTVIHGVGIERLPMITEAQELKLMVSAVTLAKEITEVRRRLGGGNPECSVRCVRTPRRFRLFLAAAREPAPR